jgi:hypothetical protein
MVAQAADAARSLAEVGAAFQMEREHHAQTQAALAEQMAAGVRLQAALEVAERRAQLQRGDSLDKVTAARAALAEAERRATELQDRVTELEAGIAADRSAVVVEELLGRITVLESAEIDSRTLREALTAAEARYEHRIVCASGPD